MLEFWLTNEDSSPFTVRYWSEELTFPAGETIKITKEMADIVFCYFSDDKLPALIRLGWSKYNSDVPAAMKRFEKIKISDKPPVKTRLVASAGGPVPLRVEKAAGRKACPA
jgi:hypothetical protein